MGSDSEKNGNMIWISIQGSVYYCSGQRYTHYSGTTHHQFFPWWRGFSFYLHTFTYRIYLWIYPCIRDIYLMSPHPHTRIWIWCSSGRWLHYGDILSPHDSYSTRSRGVLLKSENCLLICPLSDVYHICDSYHF